MVLIYRNSIIFFKKVYFYCVRIRRTRGISCAMTSLRSCYRWNRFMDSPCQTCWPCTSSRQKSRQGHCLGERSILPLNFICDDLFHSTLSSNMWPSLSSKFLLSVGWLPKLIVKLLFFFKKGIIRQDDTDDDDLVIICKYRFNYNTIACICYPQTTMGCETL